MDPVPVSGEETYPIVAVCNVRAGDWVFLPGDPEVRHVAAVVRGEAGACGEDYCLHYLEWTAPRMMVLNGTLRLPLYARPLP